MGEITVTGEDVAEVGELAEEIRKARQFGENDLFGPFGKVLDIKNAVEELSEEEGRANKTEIKDRAGYDSVEKELHLLREHDFLEVDGKSWRYVGE